ncbi:hypothetical protein QE152_g35 [Popillia japonica]|uniref:Uncharacterized protein n=1 Tax=Popillia japonica TaxID=7064 RepID=A0AAW1NKG9_POPJA
MKAERYALVPLVIIYLMMIFPRKRMKAELIVNAPEGVWGVCSGPGWITTGVTKENHVLLLVNGNATHKIRVDIIDDTRANGIDTLSLYHSHHIQRIDFNLFTSLL